jgi:hypothetical protein
LYKIIQKILKSVQPMNETKRLIMC